MASINDFLWEFVASINDFLLELHMQRYKLIHPIDGNSGMLGWFEFEGNNE